LRFFPLAMVVGRESTCVVVSESTEPDVRGSLRLVLSQRLAHSGGFLIPPLSEREETPL
jgi:hypothetical protein